MPAANGLESTQQRVGLQLFTGQGSSYLPSVSSPHASTLSNLLLNSFPPAQSLLFRPPSSPPEKKFIFDPFSLEEDTLHPVPEPPSNQFSITYPVRSPDYKSPTNRLKLPGPPLFPTGNVHPPVPSNQKPQVYIVPYPRRFHTQASDVLSPLSIPLLLSPLPTTAPPSPSELIIKIAGPEGYMNADHHKDRITRFLLSRSTQVANSLVIVWQLSHLDSGGARGLVSLKDLFAQLDEKILDSDRTALSSFTELSITIPDLVKDVAPYNDLVKPVEDDGIDLTNAVDLLEFSWHGDFVIFASKFKNLSFATLTVLNIKSSRITIQDAVTLLHSCPDLDRASLGTIQDEDECQALLSKTNLKELALPRLSHLALESNVALHPLIGRILWTAGISLSLTLTNQATANIHRLPLPWDLFSNVELNCHLTDQELFDIKTAFPAVKYNDIDKHLDTVVVKIKTSTPVTQCGTN